MAIKPALEAQDDRLSTLRYPHGKVATSSLPLDQVQEVRIPQELVLDLSSAAPVIQPAGPLDINMEQIGKKISFGNRYC